MVTETAEVFEELYRTDKHFVILESGRTGGKTIVGRDYLMTKCEERAGQDSLVCRDSYSDIKDSLFSAIKNYIVGHFLTRWYKCLENPMRIKNLRNGNNIYFLGIGGSDKSRTKSFEPEHKLEVVLFEELQQVREQESLEQAHASFRRHLTPTGKFIHMFNPPPQNAHWVNVWCKIKKLDEDYLVIHSSWRDIIHWLNDIDIKEILKCKALEPDKYKWLYEGIPSGGFGSVYPQFKREKHLLSYKEAVEKFKGEKITSVIIGGDNAVSRDATCLCPVAIFTNGQCAVLDLFYHDPQTDGDLSVSELIPYMKRWLKELEEKYQLNVPSLYGQYTPIAFVIDGSIIGIELAKQLKYVLNPNRYDIIRYTNKNVLEMAGNLKSVWARNMLYIIDFGGHYNYVKNRFEKRENVLAEQVENLIWNEKQTGFDPIVRNDACDALTYGANAIFKNMFNLYYVAEAIRNRKDYYDLEITRSALI